MKMKMTPVTELSFLFFLRQILDVNINPVCPVCSALLVAETEQIQVSSFENKGADTDGDASSLQILI